MNDGLSPLWVLAAAVLVAVSLAGIASRLFAGDETRHLLLAGALADGDGGPLHRTAAWVKLLALTALAVGVALAPLDRLAVLAGLVGAVAVLARVPARLVLGRLVDLAPFVVIAGVGSLAAGDPARFALVMGRALTVLCGLVVLLVTTPAPQLLAGLRALRVPAVFVSTLGLALRYLGLLLDEGSRMGQAFAMRAVGPRDLRLARPLGRVVGGLLVRSVERSERVHAAMLARGYDGSLPTLARPPAVTLAQVAALVGFVVAVTAVVRWPGP